MNFCSQCGAAVSWRAVEDDRERHVCDNCDTIHYQNPKMVVGAIPSTGEKILICRRSIEPCRGMWTLPAGYLENGETIEQCARRETMEEATAKLENLRPYTLVNLPFINQVYFMFLADLVNDDFHAGSESLEVKLIKLDEIPWENIAFSVIEKVLTLYCHDSASGSYPFRVLNLDPPETKLRD